MSKRIRRRCAALAAATLLFGALGVGCGGGSGDNAIAASNSAAPNSAFVTRDTAGRFGNDSLILAARLADSPGISLETATTIDADITRIRSHYAAVQNLHARPDYDLRSLLVGVRQGTPWLENWRQGSIATGDAALDSLLTRYSALRPTALTDTGDTIIFKVEFAQPLAMNRLAEQIEQAAVPGVAYAETDGIAGDGDNLTREVNGARIYIFSQGRGDCPAGCIERQYWRFTLTGDDQIALEEYGDPITDRPRPQ